MNNYKPYSRLIFVTKWTTNKPHSKLAFCDTDNYEQTVFHACFCDKMNNGQQCSNVVVTMCTISNHIPTCFFFETRWIFLRSIFQTAVVERWNSNHDMTVQQYQQLFCLNHMRTATDKWGINNCPPVNNSYKPCKTTYLNLKNYITLIAYM